MLILLNLITRSMSTIESLGSVIMTVKKQWLRRHSARPSRQCQQIGPSREGSN